MVLNLSLFHAAFYATTLGIRSPEKQGRLRGEVSGQLILLGRVSAEERGNRIEANWWAIQKGKGWSGKRSLLNRKRQVATQWNLAPENNLYTSYCCCINSGIFCFSLLLWRHNRKCKLTGTKQEIIYINGRKTEKKSHSFCSSYYKL